MSSQTNIPINSRSMNGIITISDGGGTLIQNGQITTSNLFAPNVATLNENEAITGTWNFNTALPTSTINPTTLYQFTNKNYVDSLDTNNVKLTGNQTIASGAVKTFTTLPQSSATPSLAAELITKNYCDGLDAQNVKLSGNQTIASGAIKTFTTLPQSSATPSLAAELITKNYCDGLDAQNVKLTGNQTLTTGIKTFTNLPQCTAVPSNNADLVNKLYADGLTSGFATLAGNQTFTTGVKTFTNLPQSTAVPAVNGDLTNKSYVDTLDNNNVKLTGNQSVGGNKSFSSVLRVSDSVANGYIYLGTGTNECGIYQYTGYSYIQSKNDINFYTNTTGGGSASRVVVGDAGLLINTGGKLYLDNTLTTYISQTTNLMNFYAPTSSQFKWLINSVQCGILDGNGLTLTGGLTIGNGQNIQLNSGGSTISSGTTDMLYTATGASANHYFNIGSSTIMGINANGMTIQDTKILQFGSTNTTNIQKTTASSRLDYNVPTGFTHSKRVNGVEVMSVGGASITASQQLTLSTPHNFSYGGLPALVAGQVGYTQDLGSGNAGTYSISNTFTTNAVYTTTKTINAGVYIVQYNYYVYGNTTSFNYYAQFSGSINTYYAQQVSGYTCYSNVGVYQASGTTFILTNSNSQSFTIYLVSIAQAALTLNMGGVSFKLTRIA